MKSTDKKWYCHHIEEHHAPEYLQFPIDDDNIGYVRIIYLCQNCVAVLRDKIRRDETFELAEYVETRMRFSMREMK